VDFRPPKSQSPARDERTVLTSIRDFSFLCDVLPSLERPRNYRSAALRAAALPRNPAGRAYSRGGSSAASPHRCGSQTRAPFPAPSARHLCRNQSKRYSSSVRSGIFLSIRRDATPTELCRSGRFDSTNMSRLRRLKPALHSQRQRPISLRSAGSRTRLQIDFSWSPCYFIFLQTNYDSGAMDRS
jgi:hypothetical protein